MIISTSTSHTVAVVGYDLISQSPLRQSLRARTIVRAGLSGSAAALDTEIRIMAGAVEIATMFNNATGAVQADAGLMRVNWPIPSSQNLSAIVVDAPASSPINLVLELS